MTTSVKVKACCSDDREVVVNAGSDQAVVMQNGEEKEFFSYDDRVVAVRERMKGSEQPPADNDHIDEGSEKFPEDTTG